MCYSNNMTYDITKLKRNYELNPLRKGEYPEKEDLVYLYLELNYTAKEVCSIVRKGDVNAVAKWCKYYNISKSREQQIISSKQFFLRKYGVENVAHLDSVKEKKKAT